MTPELVAAIKARILAGQEESLIKQSVLEGGHAEDVFVLAYKQASDEIVSGGVSSAIPTAPQALPSVFSLVEDAFSFAFSKLFLVGLIFVPSIIAFILTAVPEFFSMPASIGMVLQALAIPFYILYVFNATAVLYMVATGGETTYKEGLVWVRQNIGAIIFIYILMTLAIFGGFLLFIIPGLVLLITLYFAPYSLVLDGKRGIAALLYSRELVQGKFWVVLYKMVGSGLIAFIPVFLVAFLYGMAVGFGDVTLPHVEFIGNFLLEIFSAFYSVMGFHVLTRMYKILQTHPHEETSSSLIKVLYGFLMFIGLITVPLLIFFAYKFGWDEAAFDTMPLTPSMETMVLRGELTVLGPVAQDYYKTQASFENVCATLTPLLSVTEGIECNDSDSAWAIAAVEGDERWCADATTEAKIINTPLGEHTACIALKKQSVESKEPAISEASTTQNTQE